MGLGGDSVILVPAGTVFSAAGNMTSGVDLSGYASGLLCINVTANGTTFTPVFQISDDTTNWDAIPTGILAAPGAITTVSRNYYPFLPANLALPKLMRLAWTSVTGSFTFGAKAYMRR